jgi:asparagine synthase (glutamine-hydrolysing)
MCGINGIFSKQPIADPSRIDAMNLRIVHRGPDDEGTFVSRFVALGMRRLSIIDLSQGHQPIYNEDKSLAIVFNGEIYNYRRLREGLLSRGHAFTTDTDTEVIVHLFEEKREKCVEDLNGMFAFAVYDTRKNELFLARDRVGKKPLYYCRDGDEFLFASELKSILAITGRKYPLDHRSLELFFAFTFIPAPYTIFEGIRKLEPGHTITVSGDLSIRDACYWYLPSGVNSLEKNPDLASCSKGLRDLLYDSVQKRMIADVPLGAFLSGGIDSTIIVAIMAELDTKPIKTFTIRNSVKIYDESDKARAIAQKYKTDHTEWTVDADYIVDRIDDIIAQFDEPFADSSALPSYIVSELAGRHVKVVLTGDGGDELYAGYTRYLIFQYLRAYHALPGLLRNGAIKPLVNLIPFPGGMEIAANKIRKLVNNDGADAFEQHHQLQRLGLTRAEIDALLPGVSSRGFPRAFSRPVFDAVHNRSPLDSALVTDIVLGLEGDMLVKLDRTSMMNSVEARSPYLDYRLIEHAFTIPESFKLRGARLKWILKNAFADKFPPDVLRKPKMGFGIPIGRLLKRELSSRFKDLMEQQSLRDLGLIDIPGVQALYAEHCSNRDRTFPLWTFFVFASWVKRNLHRIA